MAHRLQLYIACSMLLLLNACGNKSDDVSGIEVGNPTIGVSTHFEVNYGVASYPELLRAGVDSMQLDPFHLDLLSVNVFSSYYFTPHTYYDPSIGNQVWPGEDDTVPTLATFGSDPADSVLPDIIIATDALFKEVEYVLRPGENAGVTGSLLWKDGKFHPFFYLFPQDRQWRLRYHRAQVEDLGGGRYDLQVRFHVPQWTENLDIDSAVLVNDTLRFDSTYNMALWDSLTTRIPFAFGSAHTFTIRDDGDTSHYYAPAFLEQFVQPGVQLVRNSRFANDLDQWIVVNQLGGISEQTVKGDTLFVRILEPGSNTWSVQLIQEDIPLVQGKTYRFSCETGGDQNSYITVRTGMYHLPYSAYGLIRTMTVDSVAHKISQEFTVSRETSYFVRLEFNLSSGMAKTVWLRNVRLEPVE